MPKISLDMPNEIVSDLKDHVGDSKKFISLADFKDIDMAIKKGLNHPLGPFELTDYSGLDISYYSKLKIYNETKNPKDKPKKFLEEKVKDGKLGVKTGEGFYNYDKPSKS